MINWEHGGNIRAFSEASGLPPEEILDFSASINPLGPPEWLRSLISSRISSLCHYPDPESRELVAALSEQYGLPQEQLLVGNGAGELIFALPRALAVGSALIPVPSYGDYHAASLRAGLKIHELTLSDEAGFRLDWQLLEQALQPGQLVFLGRPNNPTGTLFDSRRLRQLAQRHGRTWFLVDESFLDLTQQEESLLQQRPGNVVVVRSMTKSFAIAGLRLGFLAADEPIIRALRNELPGWSVNSLAQAVGERAVRDQAYLEQSRSEVARLRRQLAAGLATIPGLTLFPGSANFLLLRSENPNFDAERLSRLLLKEGIAIRPCSSFRGLDQRYFRLAVRPQHEQQRLLSALRRIFGLTPLRSVKPARPALMLQGTGSNAGKSIMATAFCRILLQDGYRVAPFKAQNMSLNSAVTRNGEEMGRAQALQAQACRLDPDVRMNPILLKPNSEAGSQVILLGRPVGNQHFRAYAARRDELFSTVCSAYDQLATENEVMVLEGAGSPGEVNLKARDIVNMAMARHAEAPVLLVGDIDRGGLYASLVGHMEVLAEWERALVVGFLVNRFRGDAGLLEEAHSYLQEHTGRPVLGVVPYLERLALPDEDSVSFKEAGDERKEGAVLDIALIDLPRISNFTDFDPLRQEPDLQLRRVGQAEELGRPDAVLIPGSKNVQEDLAHLRRNGLAQAIQQLAAEEDCEVVGICGGFQMLGERLCDPHAVESAGGEASGLGLLPMSTTLEPEKVLSRSIVNYLPSGESLSGYEIHHGESSAERLHPLFVAADGRVIGGGRPDGRIWGTYLHGLFENDRFRRDFLNRLRGRRNLPPLAQSVCFDLEPALDRLADTVRNAVDLPRIYRLMGLR